MSNEFEEFISRVFESLTNPCKFQKEEIIRLGKVIVGNNSLVLSQKNTIARKIDENKILSETIVLDVKEIEELKDKINGLIKPPTDIPNADITYQRPVLVGPNHFKQVEMDIRNFIMPDFTIEKAVKSLRYNGSQDLDELIPKLYLKAKSNYKYGSDTQYGFSEYLMFPYELRFARSKGLAGDCDDWANKIGSYFAAANIPRDKWLISFGWARNNIGHATVYTKDSTGIWRHLNSTKKDYSHSDLKLYPSRHNNNDYSGLKPSGIWFSYNDVFSIHQFESREASATFKKELGDKITIKRKRKWQGKN